MAVEEVGRRLIGGVWVTNVQAEGGGSGGGSITEVVADDDSIVVSGGTGPTVGLSADIPFVGVDPPGSPTDGMLWWDPDDDTPSGDPPFTPATLTDLALWLDASTLDLADDDPITTWPDASGNGYDAAGVTVGEANTVDITGASSGAFTLSVLGQVTSALAWNVTANQMQTALLALSTVEPGLVVTKDAQVYTVTYAAAQGSGVALIESPGDLDVTPTVTQVGNFIEPPKFKTSALNGLGVARFLFEGGDGGSFKRLTFSGDALAMFNSAPGLTCAAVVRNRDDGFGQQRLLGGLLPDGSNVRVDFFFDDGSYDFGLNILVADDQSKWLNTTMVYATSFRGAFTLVCSSSLTVGPSATAQSSVAGTQPLTLSSSWDEQAIPNTDCLSMEISSAEIGGQNTIQDADLCELVVVTRSLDVTERRQLMEYLSSKWATL